MELSSTDVKWSYIWQIKTFHKMNLTAYVFPAEQGAQQAGKGIRKKNETLYGIDTSHIV